MIPAANTEEARRERWPPEPMNAQVPAGERFPQELDVLRELADGLPQIVWVARPDGSHEYYNKQWRDYTGLALHESTREAWNARFHPADRERAETLWEEARRHGTPYEIEFRLQR